MKSVEEMMKQVDEMPADQWFSMKEINGGIHSPGLWQQLCHMDDGLHVRKSDGAIFKGSECRLSFVWESQKSAYGWGSLK